MFLNDFSAIIFHDLWELTLNFLNLASCVQNLLVRFASFNFWLQPTKTSTWPDPGHPLENEKKKGAVDKTISFSCQIVTATNPP